MPGRAAIIRIDLERFMQYDTVSIRPGENLNLIIGPNGSGKSSIVNAICLGLAGKPSSLGRAQHVSEFIRTGQDTAKIEIELHNPDPGKDNYVIERVIDTQNKSVWRINYKAVKEKDVLALARQLNIQTDNLCQFLPQDKVHEFSKMNPKELLSRTIDAVGEKQLKEDHDHLRRLQTEISDSEHTHNRRLQALAESEKKIEALEAEVKCFNEKSNLRKKIVVLEKKKLWINYEEQKVEFKAVSDKFRKVEKKLRKEMAKIQPLLEYAETKNKELEKINEDDRMHDRDAKSFNDKFDKDSDVIKAYNTEMIQIEEKEDALEAKEENCKVQVARIEKEIERAREELQDADDDPTLKPKIDKLSQEMNQLLNRKQQLQAKIDGLNDNRKSLSSQLRRYQAELEKKENVQNVKLGILAKFNGGGDVVNGVKWLQQNMDEFEGNPYFPILMNIDVTDPNNALYLENVINNRDIRAFCADNTDDANKLMRLMRQSQQLRVNVLQINPRDHPDNYVSKKNQRDLQKYGFKGYVKDMFSAPDPIKAYLCKNYGLQDIPVFDEKAEKNASAIVDNFKFRTFFIGSVRYSSKGSKYSSNISTSTARVSGRNMLCVTKDIEGIRQIKREMENVNYQFEQNTQKTNQYEEQLRETGKQHEENRNVMKDLKDRMQHKTMLERKLNHKHEELKRVLLGSNFTNERRKLKERRFAIVEETKVTAKRLSEFAIKTCENLEKSEILKLKSSILSKLCDKANKAVAHFEERTAELRESVETERAYKDRALNELNIRLEAAREGTAAGYRGDGPPKALLDDFQLHEVPSTNDEVQLAIDKTQHEMECLDDVDPKVIREYQETKENIGQLELDVARFDQAIEEKSENMEKIRDRWLEKLSNLVERIGVRFAEYFQMMGFAGDVILGKGNNENDFANFGINIMVKYRNNMPLARLDPHQQSGGERSVATALYMLALQELTVVPFRFVDEINQGMDAVNERRVFDLLVRVSCHERSSQYFLLTPKLLPSLKYDAKMSVLVVHNGDEMCHKNDWDQDKFLAAMRRPRG